MPAYVRVRSKGQIILPLYILRTAQIREGDLLEVSVEEDGSLRLVPGPSMDHALAEEQQLADIEWALRVKGKSR